MDDSIHPFLLPVAICMIAAAPVQPALAAVYLSTDAAQRQLFPAATTFEPCPLVVSPEQARAIAQLAGTQAQHGTLRAWTARQGDTVIGHVFIDQVLGRNDFITYAVGIDADGKLRPVEIIEYRESHGGEIRNPTWLAQFDGRSRTEDLAMGSGIKNISGATISSEHVTAGVRRILALWQTTLAKSLARGS